MVRRTVVVDDEPLNGHSPEPMALGGDISNAGEGSIIADAPYRVAITLEGVSAVLFHRWQSDSVEAKAAAAKGSKQKKTDDLESYIWRDDDGLICLPGEYLRGTLIDPRNGSAKYRQDPRSPRKSALDLYRASIVALTELGPITRADGSLAEAWDYVDRRRVTVQRSGITRERPAFAAGWKATLVLQCQSPAYIPPRDLHQALNDAGRLVGVADFRPSFGRFVITNYEVLSDETVI